MSNFSSLVTRDISRGGASRSQAANTLRWHKKGKNTGITFPKETGMLLRESGFTHMEYRVNELTKEVFLVFSAIRTPQSLEISFENSENRKLTRKLAIRSLSLVEWLILDLDLSGEGGVLKLSENISRTEDMIVFKVTAQ